ncbi:hypothetical protein SO802_002770 [Lithocarpus litseifolius]|uniref:Uncharacterized protein n=1 Tax=Lithocarpus litseifolius TaxID=425828 RepID=A0AAW2DZ27_9ROSI
MGCFWEDIGVVMLKAHEAISVEDLKPLGVRSSHKLMSSHVHRSCRSQFSALLDEAKKDKDHLKTLEKSIDTEKAFSKLKDK